MSEEGARDALARRRAQEEFVRPLVLEAGAGTGKTAALTARVLAWSLGPGWERAVADRPGAPPEEVAAATWKGVLAITFTEAAAAEMAERVSEALGLVAAGTAPNWLVIPEGEGASGAAARAVFLSAALDQLNISTIHGYCLALLRAESLAAGVHPGFEVDADGSRVREAVRAELADWLPEAATSPAMGRLVAAGGSLTRVGEALVMLVTAGVEAAELAVPGADEVWRWQLAELAEALAALVEVAGGLARVSARSSRTRATWAAVQQTRSLLETTGQGELEAVLARMAALWPENCRTRLREWGRGEWNDSERAALGDAVPVARSCAGKAGDHLEALLAAQPAQLAAAAEVLSALLERVQERLRRSGVVTFEGLLRGAERLLTRHPAVAARERARLQQVLVDEFQDTDQVQCQLVARLCLDSPPGQRPGLFVVGDPKQSIYAWRSADLAAYEAFVTQVKDAGGEVHRLSVNFRSVPAILAEVERVIAPAMVKEPGVQPAFQPLLPCPERQRESGFRAGRRAPVEYWESPVEEGEQASTLAARAVATDVAALHRQGVAWERVGILLRTTGELESYLEALRQAGVPYAAARERSYYKRREVIEAAALLRLLADPTDQVALLTWLRSPLVGVPDAALVPLWRAGFPRLLTDLLGPDDPSLDELETMIEEAAGAVPAGVPGIDRVGGWTALLAEGVRRVAELRWWLEREPFPAWLERVRQATWLEAGEAVRFLGRFRLANLDALFRELERQVEEAGGDRRAVLQALRRALAAEERRDTRQPGRGALDGVQVMTIHAAKGLDFDHVYLVEAHRALRGGGGEENLVVRVGPQLYLKLLGYPWPGWQEGARLRRAQEEAELVRTLYVALTRARDRLVVVGDWQPRRRQGAGSHLELCRHRRPSLDWEAAKVDDEGWRWVDVDGARWVRPPALAASGRRVRVEAAGMVGEGEHLTAEAARLAALAAGARQRAARPRGGTVTGEAHRREEERGPAEATAAGAAAARAAGTAVHAVLEQLDLGQPIEGQLRRWVGQVEDALPDELTTEERDAAARRAREVLERLLASPLAGRLQELAGAVLGREVPLLLPGEEEGEGPLGYLSGAVDFLYWEAPAGPLVVADFKTDAVESEEELARAVKGYARQGELYCRAVQQALGLPGRPHFELWFLQMGRIVRLW